MNRIKKIWCIFAVLVAVGMGTGGLTEVLAQSQAAKFYKGRTLKIIVPFQPGGGYDAIIRLMAPYLKKHTGAQVVVINKIGAGGLIGYNELYAAKPDGLTMGVISGLGAACLQIKKDNKVKYDLLKYTLIGGIGKLEYLLCLGKNSEFNSIKDVINSPRPVKFAMGGAGSGMNIGTRLVTQGLGIPLHPVLGFSGTTESFLSVFRGEVDGVCTNATPQLPHIKSGELIPVAFIDKKRYPLLPDVPSVMEIGVKPEGMEAIMAVINITSIGRMLVAPPGVEEQNAQFLRDVLVRCFNEKELLTQAEKLELGMEFMDKDELKETVGSALGVSKGIVDVIEAAYKVKK